MQHIRCPNILQLDNVTYVAKNGNDSHTGTIGDPLLTIQAAIDLIVSSGVLSLGQRVVIEVYPGIYTEQIKSYQGIYINGIIQNVTTSEGGAVTIYNTGADEAHYPLSGEDGHDVWLKNIILQTDTGGVFGKLSNSRFNTVLFVGGEFIEGTENKSLYIIWKNCAFLSCNAFNLTGVAPQGRYLVFEQVWFGWWKNIKFESTHTTGNAVFDMDGGHLAFTQLNLKGDWYHFAKNYHSFGAYRHNFDTTKGISYRNVTISNGIHFISNPLSFQMIGCEMDDAAEMPIPADETDITADVPITNCLFVNNAMHNGLCGNIQIQDPIKNVGGSAINKYFDLTQAVLSVTGEDLVVLHENLIDIPKLTMPTTGTVQIKGNAGYSLTFTGDIVDLGEDDKLVFDNCGDIQGGTVQINGNNAEFHMHGCICQNNAFQILMTSGTGAKVHIEHSNLHGSAGYSALQVNSLDPTYKISNSRLIGATGQPAIEFTVLASSKLQGKFSTFLHGDGGANAPISYTGAGKVDIEVYASGLNATWNPASFQNLIVSAGNITDSNINF